MNKQRKVLITVTYNEMGIIIDTKAEEVAQPNLQPTCNQLATDSISRQAAIDALVMAKETGTMKCGELKGVIEVLNRVTSEQPIVDVNKWIPSSEKMPEMERFYIVTYGEHVTLCHWFENRWQRIGDPERITAWMPLPEPYKEDSE